jgi:hypothetical protein
MKDIKFGTSLSSQSDPLSSIGNGRVHSQEKKVESSNVPNEVFQWQMIGPLRPKRPARPVDPIRDSVLYKAQQQIDQGNKNDPLNAVVPFSSISESDAADKKLIEDEFERKIKKLEKKLVKEVNEVNDYEFEANGGVIVVNPIAQQVGKNPQNQR